MNLHQLKSFLAVAQHGQIFRAAEELHVSQPALSRQMAALESDIGVPLLERHARGVTLTRAGEALHKDASDILARMESMVAEIRSGEHLKVNVKVGVPPGVPSSWLRERLGQAPESTRISLIEAPTDRQLAMLKRRELDIVLARSQSESFPTKLVLRQRMGIVVRLDSPLHDTLSNRTVATLYDLEGLRVLAHSRGEIRVQEEVLKNAMRSVDVDATWIFRTFGQYSALIADFVEADVALTTKSSATRNFPGWEWVPLEAHDASGKDLVARTWATWEPQAAPEVIAIVELLTGEE